MRPYELQVVGYGESLLPWRNITGVRVTGPAPPKPSTGTPSDASTITGNPAGKDRPTSVGVLDCPRAAGAARAAISTATAPADRSVQLLLRPNSMKSSITTDNESAPKYSLRSHV